MLGYLLCGALQLLFLFGYPVLIGTGLIVGYEWVLVAAGPADIYLRSVIVGVAGFLGLSLLPIVVKWLLIGRWKPQEFPIWSLRYFRFWLVKTLIRTNPLVRFAGSPLYVLYLRLLGAKIGTGATILSPTVPVCTDMLTIGVGALIRKTSTFSGYRAHDGLIQTGPVHIGRDAIVGEATVLDIGSSVGEGAQLGHASSLHAGQAVPYGQRWHGSPAEPTSLTYRRVRGAGCSGLRKAAYSVVQLLLLLGVVLPLGISSLILLVSLVPQLAALLGEGPPAALTWTFYRDALVLSTALFIGALLFGLSVMIIVPRLLRVLVRPNKVYRLYGISYWAHRTIGRLTNSKFFLQVFGDTRSCWLLAGARLRPGTGRADRVELWHRGCTRQPVPERGRPGIRGRRRADVSECRLLEHLVPGGPSGDRGKQLPRQQHLLPGPGPHGRRLPAGHQGHGPHGRSGPGGGGAARLAQLRDPADHRAGQQTGAGP